MNYYVYITTNPQKTTLYVGITNDIVRRITEHYNNKGDKTSFAGRYYCYNLIYWETFDNPNDAILRESQIKLFKRTKKEKLITLFNPEWKFFNNEISFLIQ